MTVHDFRFSLLAPQHTLIECRNLAPGRFQITGNGGAIRQGDSLLVTLKGSRELYMTLAVDKVRHLISPPGQWVATASGPVFRELAIHTWGVQCNACGASRELEFAVDASLGEAAQQPAAEARLQELGWTLKDGQHYCPQCKAPEA